MEDVAVRSIGIIGVGEIGRAIVAGLREGDVAPTASPSGSRAPSPSTPVTAGPSSQEPSSSPFPKIFLSPRGARTATELAGRYEGIEVCADNQQVVDRSDLVIIAVRGPQRHEALAELRVDAATIVVNVMAGVGIDDLRGTLGTDAPLVRAIPLPAVRERRSVTVVHPSHPEVNALFAQLGGALPVADEGAFNVLSALTGTLSTHYAYLGALTSWAAGQGIAPGDADRYVRGLFQGVGRSLDDASRSLQQLAGDHETPGGSNERIRTTWFDEANSAALAEALDGLLDGLNGAPSAGADTGRG